jgi:acetolactate decarboxylase
MFKAVKPIACSFVILASIFTILRADEKETLMQVSTLDALMSGIYEGQLTIGQLVTYGNTGIGTFQGLDGEMIVKEGVVYKIAYDGTVSKPDLSTLTPFACVTFFDEDMKKPIIRGTTLADFPKTADAFLRTVNLFYAVRIDGTFKKMKTRSVPKQTSKPYLPLAEVVKKQSTFEFENIEGTIIGLRCPPYIKGINSPGYHLHFISKDGKSGGHVLDFIIENAEMKIDVTPEFRMIVPESKDFYDFDFTKDTSADLQKVLQQPIPQSK